MIASSLHDLLTPIAHQPRVFDKCKRFKRPAQLASADLYPYFHALASAQASEIVCDGRKMIMLCSNNYLGLSTHPDVLRAAQEASGRYGTGCSGSRFLNGTLELHEELEDQLASFLGTEAAVIFPTGYQANLGVVSALTARDDLVVIDKLDHASIYDGCRLSYATVQRFRHNDCDDLARILETHRDSPTLIVVDGVYSMHGDIADLPGIIAAARRYRAGVVVDDAHALGVLGAGGRGTAENFGLASQVDVFAGTFSKSLASVGGYAAGAADTIEFIKHHARPLIFSASLPPASTAAALAALQVSIREPEWRDRLWENARFLREGLEALGYNVGSSRTPIIPVELDSESNALKLWRRLFDAGVFTSPILHPAVPPGSALIRTSCMATHTRAQLDRVLDAFAHAGQVLQLI